MTWHKRLWVWGVVGLMMVSAGAMKWRGGVQAMNGKDRPANSEWTVRRGPLTFSVTVQGYLKTSRSYQVMAPASMNNFYPQMKLKWLISEGTVVKKGEKLVELEW